MKQKPRFPITCAFSTAYADIVHRTGVYGLIIVGVIIALVIGLTIAVNGWKLYQFQKHSVMQQFPRVITAQASNHTDAEQRFGSKTIAKLKRELNVEDIYWKIELSANLRMVDGSSIQVSCENVRLDDPRVSPDHSWWVRKDLSLTDRDSFEGLIMSRRLFRKCGGTVNSAGIHPDEMTMELSRLRSGKKESVQFELPIIRLTESNSTHGVFLASTSKMVELDMWQSHRLRHFGNQHQEDKRYRYAVCWVAETQKSRARNDLKAIDADGVRLQAGKPLPVPATSHDGVFWAKAESLDNIPENCKAYRQFLVKAAVAGKRTLKIEAWDDSDERWKCIPTGRPSYGTLYSVNQADHHGPLVINGKTFSVAVPERGVGIIPSNADFLTSTRTLRKVFFKPDKCALFHRDGVFLYATDVASACNLESVLGQPLRTDMDGLSWAMCEMRDNDGRDSVTLSISDNERDSAELYPADIGENFPARDRRFYPYRSSIQSGGPAYRSQSSLSRVSKKLRNAGLTGLTITLHDVYDGGNIDARGTRPLLKTPVILRALPNSIFSRLASKRLMSTIPDSGRVPVPVILTDKSLASDGELRMNGVNIKPVAFRKSVTGLAEVWVSADDSASLTAGLDHASSCLFLQGRWDIVHKAGQVLSSEAEVTSVTVGESPGVFGVALSKLSPEIRNRLARKGKGARLVHFDYLEGRPAGKLFNLKSSSPQDTGYFAKLYPKLALCPSGKRFSEVLLQTAHSKRMIPLPEDPAVTLRFGSLMDFINKRKEVHLQPITNVRWESYTPFIVSDVKSQSIDSDLLGILKMTKPTFHSVEGKSLYDRVSVRGRDASMVSLAPDSLEQFRINLKYGRWLEEADYRDILVPLNLLEEVASNPAREWIGKTFHVTVYREGDTLNDRIDVPVRVRGVYKGDSRAMIYATDRLIQELNRWRNGELLYNRHHEFIRPSVVYNECGFPRANVIARSVDEVEDVVTELDRDGYRVKSCLGELNALYSFGKLLACVIVSFTAGVLIVASVAIFISGYSVSRQKSREYALLRTCGLRKSQVMTIPICTILIVSATSSLVAFVVTTLCEKWLVNPIFENILRLDVSSFVSNSESLPWPVVAPVLSVGLIVIAVGVLVPALIAINTDPDKALSNVD